MADASEASSMATLELGIESMKLTPHDLAPIIPPSIPLSAAQKCAPEVLDQIFGLLSPWDCLLEFSLDRLIVEESASAHLALLLPLTRICRGWWLSAVRVMYRTICIVNRVGQMDSLLKYSKRCLSLVKHFAVLWNRQPWALPFDPDLLLIPSIIDFSPSLQKITLGGEQFDLSSTALIRSLSRESAEIPDSAPITHLSFASLAVSFLDQRFGPQDRRTSTHIETLIHALPDLQEVRFDEFRSAYRTVAVASPTTLTFPHLKKIVLRKVVLESQRLELLLSPLVSLEELYMDRTSLTTVENFKRIMTVIGSRLKRLDIRDCDFWATWESDADSASLPLIDHILLSCPNLTLLLIRGSLDLVPPLLDTPHANLESLQIGNTQIDGQVLAIAILERKFPKLVHLMVLHSCGWSRDVHAEVESVCKLAEVTFVCLS